MVIGHCACVSTEVTEEEATNRISKCLVGLNKVVQGEKKMDLVAHLPSPDGDNDNTTADVA